MSLRDFKYDYYRYTGSHQVKIGEILKDHSLRYLLFLRGGALFRPFRKYLSTKYGINLGNGSNIGRGIYLGHAYGINVNPKASLGENCNLHKGCTVGQENRGARKGVPTLGDRVWVGSGAVVVGSIVVGDDVMIAPNAFVNHDVPSHSIVIGNPCKVIHREDATAGYVENCINESSGLREISL